MDEQEPVAYVYRIEANGRPCVAWDDASEIKVGAKLYAAPREWVGLNHLEPVAWISDSPTKGNGKQLHWTKSEAWRWSSNITPLYTAPPKQWVGLTDEEIAQGLKESWVTEQAWQSAVWWAEAKLKEKNGG
jgi:hypothetical protein